MTRKRKRKKDISTRGRETLRETEIERERKKCVRMTLWHNLVKFDTAHPQWSVHMVFILYLNGARLRKY